MRKNSPIARLELSDEWRCECGVFHKLGAYVAAHWDVKLTHTCENCGNKHDICKGMLTLRSVGKEKRK